MSVTLARIDDRLIHGQIVHAWIEYSKAKHLLIADDFASTDKTSQLMLRLAAPKTIKLVILSLEETINYIKENENEPIFLIVRNPESMLKLLNLGLVLSEINLGNIIMTKSQTGRKMLLKNIHVEQNDVDCLKAIAEKGVYIYIKLVPDERPIDAIDLINKKY